MHKQKHEFQYSTKLWLYDDQIVH